MKRIVLIMTLFVIVAFYITPGFSQDNTVPENELYKYYANTYPDHKLPPWGNENWAAGGIANSQTRWFFASTKRSRYLGKTTHDNWKIWSVPISYDISHFDEKNPNIKTRELYANFTPNHPLRYYGYGHIGDIDYSVHEGKGYIAAPLTSAVNGNPPVIAFFDAATLSLVHFAYLPKKHQESIGWCAFSSDSLMVTSHDETSSLLRYKIDWKAMLAKKKDWFLEIDTTFTLKDNNGDTLYFEHMQGGDFTPSGKLIYLSCGLMRCDIGVYSEGEFNDYDGIHVFETENWTRVLKSSNSKMRPGEGSFFDFKFNNNSCSGDEPEGITIMNAERIDKNSKPDDLIGHLHIIVDNHNKHQFLLKPEGSAVAGSIVGGVVGGLGFSFASLGAGLAIGATIGVGTWGFKSIFKRNSWKSKVSIQHFGPTPYIEGGDGGGRLTDEEKTDSIFFERCSEFLLKGDSTGFKNYFNTHLDENGNPIIPGIENPPSKEFHVYPDKSDKLKPDKGLREMVMPKVTAGTKTCYNPFGMNIYNGITIQKNKIGKHCEPVGSPIQILSLPTPGKLIPQSEYILDFIPVLLPSNNDYLDKSSPLPFSIYNYWNDWINKGDSYFIVTNDEIKDWGTCKRHKGLGHSPYSYFLGPENDFSCGNFRTFMNARNKYPQLLATQKIKYPLFRFSFFIPLTDGVHITDASGSLRNLPQIDLAWLKGVNNTNQEAFQNFFYNLAVIAAADPSFRFLEKPELHSKPRAVVTGKVNGRTYLAGINGIGIYSPVDCGDGKQTSLLIEKLIGNSYETSPLKRICTQYMDDENNRDVIKAFLPSDIIINGADLKTDLETIDRTMKNLNQAPTNVKFLIQRSNGDFYIDDNGNTTKVDWYSNISTHNVHLSRLAILYGDNINAYKVDDKIILLGLNTIYVFCNDDENNLPIMYDLLKDYGGTLPGNERKKGKKNISENYFHGARQNYENSRKIFVENYNDKISIYKCLK